MKTLNQYQCELCGMIFKSESECKNCEAIHKKIKSCKKVNYNAYKNNGECPKSIIVEFEDGKNGRYDFAGKICFFDCFKRK